MTSAFSGIHESVAAPVGVLETDLHLSRIARVHQIRRVGPVVPDVGAAEDLNALRPDPLAGELRARLAGQRVQHPAERFGRRVVEPRLHRPVAEHRTSASPIP